MNTLLTGRLGLIEDDEDMREVIQAFFKPRGFSVIAFENAQEMQSHLKKHTDAFDVIVTDLMMPGMSGIELIQALREDNIETPIIMVTANSTLDLAIQAVEAGAYDFILKPIPFPHLLISVQRAMHFHKMKGENKILKAVIENKEGTGLSGIIGKSQGFRQALDLAKKVSSSVAHVLISGESGTGKEIIAKALHQYGNRSKKPFVTINCSAIPENLLESELFGHAKGSFTGASEKKIGLFEEAQGGTLFLDEIGDLSLPLQAKLLRVLQDKKIRRVGENQQRSIDVRVVAATHKDLKQEVLENRFREDLFFRLNVIPIRIPPLRKRKEDILPLAEFFLKRFAITNSSPASHFSREATESLIAHPWRGNVRELENTIERAVVLASGPIIESHDLIDFEGGMDFTERTSQNTGTISSNEAFQKSETGFKTLPLDKISSTEGTLKLEELSRLYIQKVLEKNGGSKDKTARELGIDRKTLYRKLTEMKNLSQQQLGPHLNDDSPSSLPN